MPLPRHQLEASIFKKEIHIIKQCSSAKGKEKENKMLAWLLVMLLMMASLVSIPLQYIVTQQRLSKECLNMLRIDLGNTCPNPEKAYDLDLQQVCCNSSHTLQFHCQLHDDKMFPACVPEEACKPGFSCGLEIGSDGLPKINQQLCANGYFASERSSVSEMYPFCRDSHTTCKKHGQTVYCRGDGTSDTRCMCKDGYATRGHECDKAFTQHSVCDCVPSDASITYCPAWKHSEIPFCTRLLPEELLINMTDCPETTKQPTERITAFGTTQKDSTAFGTTEQNVTNTPPPAEKGEQTAMSPWLIAVMIALLTATVVVVVIFRAKIKAALHRVRVYISRHILPEQALHERDPLERDPHEGDLPERDPHEGDPPERDPLRV